MRKSNKRHTDWEERNKIISICRWHDYLFQEILKKWSSKKYFRKVARYKSALKKSITFLQQWAILSIFSRVCWPFVCLLWINVCLGLLSILWLGCLLFWYWTDCIFWQLILHFFVCNFFSHSEDCLFILFILSFAMQKLLNLIRSYLFIFVFISVTLQSGSKRLLLWFMSKNILPMISSKSL